MSFDIVLSISDKANGTIIGKLMQKRFYSIFISKRITIMKQLKLRFEIAMWDLFLTSVILIWPILTLFDTGWLSTFKNNITATVDQFIEELENKNKETVSK